MLCICRTAVELRQSGFSSSSAKDGPVPVAQVGDKMPSVKHDQR